jgi:hypothetical protein
VLFHHSGRDKGNFLDIRWVHIEPLPYEVRLIVIGRSPIGIAQYFCTMMPRYTLNPKLLRRRTYTLVSTAIDSDVKLVLFFKGIEIKDGIPRTN